MSSNPYLHILFSNVCHLLKVDLSKYKMYPVEEKNFKELLKFLKDLIDNVESLSKRNQLSSENLNAAYAIPILFRAYESNKDDLNRILKLPSNDRKAFLKFIYRALDKYYRLRKIDRNLKNILGAFFEHLANQYAEQYQFEKLDDLNDEPYQFESLEEWTLPIQFLQTGHAV